jgi:hypothetical protein
VKTLHWFLVGESCVHMHPNCHINAGVEQSVSLWPSDHRAVVVDFQVDDFAPAPFLMVGSIGRHITAQNARIFGDQPPSVRIQSPEVEFAVANERSRKDMQSVSIRDGTDCKVFVFNFVREKGK